MKGLILVAFASLAVSACGSTPKNAPPETLTLRGQLERCTPGEDVVIKGRRAKCMESKQVQIGVCDPADPKTGKTAKCTRFQGQ